EFDRILVDGKLLPRNELVYNLSVNPGSLISQVSVSGSAGQQIGFANARTRTRLDVELDVTVRPTPRPQLTSAEGLALGGRGAPGADVDRGAALGRRRRRGPGAIEAVHRTGRPAARDVRVHGADVPDVHGSIRGDPVVPRPVPRTGPAESRRLHRVAAVRLQD